MRQQVVITEDEGKIMLKFWQKGLRIKRKGILNNVIEIVENFNDKGYALIKLLNNVYVFISSNGKMLARYDEINFLPKNGTNGYIVGNYSKYNDMIFWGYIDNNLIEIIPSRYTYQKTAMGFCFYDMVDEKKEKPLYIVQTNGYVNKLV